MGMGLAYESFSIK